MKTVTITNDQHEFLESLTKEMTEQSNRMTQYPVFYVYEKKELWVDGDDSATRLMFVDEEGQETTEQEGEDGNLWEKVDGEWQTDWINQGTKEQIDSYEACDRFELRLIHVREEDVPVVDVGPFFSEKAAQQHINSNDYHYRKPFIYVNSAWRNYELQEVLQLLFTLVGKEIPSQYK